MESGGIAPRILNVCTRWRWGSASRPGRFTSGERAPGTHRRGCWVGPRDGLNAVVKGKKPFLPQPGIKLRSPSP